MKKKIFIIIAVIILLVSCSVVSSYMTQKRMNKDYAISIADGELYNLSYVMDALEQLDKSKIKDPVIREKLETILVTSLMDLKEINPQIKDLQGIPVNTLCRIVKYYRTNGIAKGGIGKYKDKFLVNQSEKYLDQIEPSLRAIARNSSVPFWDCNDFFGIKKEYKFFKSQKLLIKK